MKLMTKELLKKIPSIGETSEETNPMVWTKLFYPYFNWYWYVIETDGEDECFGLVDGFERELGSFSLKELKKIPDAMGCPIERDLYFEPIRLHDLQKKLGE